MQTVALIDYGAGNLRSVERALEAAAHQAKTASRIVMTDDPAIVARADRIVLPGQGAFADCMAGLRARAGVIAAMEERVRAAGAPFLGICVGMQLLADEGLEHETTKGLGWIGGACRELATAERLPHMGWNQAVPTRAHPIAAPLGAGDHVYFCHSFALEPQPEAVLATAEHGVRFCCAVAAGNIAGVQFHPEKSQRAGLAILAAFLDWTP
jgi:glutamine amidotransferase